MLRRILRLLRWSDSRGEAGAYGEKLASEWLQRTRGFTVVTRNWRNPRDRREEIDLVCRDGEVLVFVEVKTRGADALVPGYYAVNRRKKRALHRAISTYLAQLRDKPQTFRFDVVEVALSAGGAAADGTGAPEIRHFENIPLFSKNYRP